MITVRQAELILFKNVVTYPSIRVSLDEAFGQVLREDVRADRDLPPFDRATMDGIAVNSAAFAKGVRAFSVEGLQKAGSPALPLRSRNACLEITTGAVMPKGCDCVIPVEYVEMDGRAAKVRDEFHPPSPETTGNPVEEGRKNDGTASADSARKSSADEPCEAPKRKFWSEAGSLKGTTAMAVGFQVRPGVNVHRKGSDARKGDILLRAGCRLAAAQIAVAAAVGKSRVLVTKAPAIALVGTGDELVEIDQPVKPFEIRRSNTCALAAGLALNGYTDVKRFHIRDDQKKLRAGLKKILRKYDVVILSGGVSMGKLDFVPGILEELGVKVLFHRVRQRPGGPLLFGKTSDGKPVFGLPGNPVSTQICFYRYVLAYLNKAAGLPPCPEYYVVLSEPAEVKTASTHFLPVTVTSSKDGRLNAAPVSPRNSGDFVSLAKSDGFIELPLPSGDLTAEGSLSASGAFHLRKGSVQRFYPWVNIS